MNAPEHCHFRLVRPKDHDVSYKVFYFLPMRKPTKDRVAKRRPPPEISSKVDVLLPGIMHLPMLSPDLITWKTDVNSRRRVNLPVVPFPVLLLQKLQGWDDHRLAVEERHKKKVPFDERDLWWALHAGVDQWLNDVSDEWSKKREDGNWDVWSDRRLFSEEFEALSRERIKIICRLCPSLAGAWEALGFEIL